MPNKHNSKHPVISSIFIALIPVVLLSVAGVVIAIGSIGETQGVVLETQGYVVQAIACALSVLAGLLIVRKSGLSFKEIGFCRPARGTGKTVFYYIPIVVLLLLLFIVNFSDRNTIARTVILLIFTILVGVNEELFFRGILIQRLKKLGIKKAILISSLLFGVLHAATILGGSEPLYVVLQILFALAFGLVAAEVSVITESLLAVIIWHFLHDFISFITSQTLNNTALIVFSVQVAILVLLAFVLWKRIDFTKTQ